MLPDEVNVPCKVCSAQRQGEGPWATPPGLLLRRLLGESLLFRWGWRLLRRGSLLARACVGSLRRLVPWKVLAVCGAEELVLSLLVHAVDRNHACALILVQFADWEALRVLSGELCLRIGSVVASLRHGEGGPLRPREGRLV